MLRSLTLTLTALCAGGLTAAAQSVPSKAAANPPAAPAAAAAPAAGRPTLPAPAPDEPQPYEKVITREAKSKTGVFTVHQVRDKYYYEIPTTELNKDFLWVSRIAKTVASVGVAGQELSSGVVRWERAGNKVNLREMNYSMVADPRQPIASAVAAMNNSSILMTFPIAALGHDDQAAGDRMVIDVTRLFATDVPEIGARTRLQATAFDPARSSIERISAYPTNIEVESSMTYTRAPGPPGAPVPPPDPVYGSGMHVGSATVVLHHSMVKLPEDPMKPRLYDERVGYLTRRHMDYGLDEQRASERRFIVRWRLEKKDSSAAVSEPVKPLTYYIDPATPTKYVPYLKAGVESWQKALEAAGFRRAIIARTAPTPEEDPDFNLEDARYSIVRWEPSTIENAVGPFFSDPRTGEILSGTVYLSHNILNLARMWYFVQASPLDPRAQKLPLPDDLMGRLVQYVCAHEVGHTLGLEHNMKASSQYPQEKVRDREWVHKMGHAPSIMDYTRFNYVAQPEDNIDPADLIPGVGPYDIWAIHWGYAPAPGAPAPDDERPMLDRWAREQDEVPWYRFSTARSAGADPGELTEAVGDADAVKSTALGLKNLERVSRYLVSAVSTREGDSYDLLAEAYGRLIGQWTLEMGHVAAIIGGFTTRERHVGQDGVEFLPISRTRQAEAVKFLNENAFHAPRWMLDPQILRRIEAVGGLSRIRTAQTGVLNNVLSSLRFARLVEEEALDGAETYSAVDLLSEVRKGLWKELESSQVKIDAARRNLQRAYLDLAAAKINAAVPAVTPGQAAGASSASTDEAAMYRAELKSLSAALAAAAPRASDRATKAHIDAARDQIARVLDTRSPSRNGSPAPGRLPGSTALDACWPNYIVLP